MTMSKAMMFLIGVAAGLAAALPFGLDAQDVRALAPGSYHIAVAENAAHAWRINTVNGTVSVCAAPDEPAGSTAPRCSPWGADFVGKPAR
jgi:hypothetical protein